MTESPSRDMLIRTAQRLIRQKGYDGVGVAEILQVAGLPKGSLYHHFPGGKRELAEAATRAGGAAVERTVDRLFAEAPGFTEGAIKLCAAIAELIAHRDQVLACPVTSILQAGVQEPALRAAGQEILASWAGCLTRHARRFGVAEPEAEAEMLIMQLEGAWVLSLAEQAGAPFLRLAAWLQRPR